MVGRTRRGVVGEEWWQRVGSGQVKEGAAAEVGVRTVKKRRGCWCKKRRRGDCKGEMAVRG